MSWFELPNAAAALAPADEQHLPEKNITWEEFEQEYLPRKEDSFKYEWVRGRVVKTTRDMNQYHLMLLNIQKQFVNLQLAGKVSGEILTEIDTFFLKKSHRRPDIAGFQMSKWPAWRTAKIKCPASSSKLSPTTILPTTCWTNWTITRPPKWRSCG